MDVWNEESGDGEVLDDFRADQREVQIARAAPLGVKRRMIVPPVTGDGAAAQHDGRARRNRSLDLPAEGIEEAVVAVEREPDDVVAFVLLAEAALHRLVWNRIDHAGTSYKRYADPS